MENLMEKIVSLCKRRGFIFPGSDIYGGLANSWDYGPLGVELKNNIKQEWWRRFVHQRPDMVGIDAALIMNPKVWEASGHLENFTDPLIECKKCHQRFRADELPKNEKISLSKISDSKSFLEIACPNCGAEGLWTDPQLFNMMFKTFMGPVDEKNVAYFRPETAQGMFVNFKNILDTQQMKLPFGIAQVGKAFRNEITPGNFIFRTREFEQMEIEYFVKENEWEKWFEYWLNEMKKWLKDLGVREKMVEYTEISKDELAHYSKRTIDIEYKYPFGQKELYGLAYRTDFDLKNHMEKSGQDLYYVDLETKKKILPHVIEPTWGVDRSMLVAMLEAYQEEAAPTARSTSSGQARSTSSGQAEDGETETRIVMKFPKWLAPIKVAILPLSKKEELTKVSEEIFAELRPHFMTEYHTSGSIGKRYRRQDEIGTPYCVTVDFESLEDKAVTVRDRDTMKQERTKISELKEYLKGKLGISN